MKKTIAITLAAITILMLTISACFADPIDWKDSTYNFKGKNTVAIYELDFNKVNINSDVRKMNWAEKYIKESGKHHLNSFVVIEPDTVSNTSDLYVIAEVEKYNNYWQNYEAYTSWESQRREHTWKDNNGSFHTDYWYETVPVYHPARSVEYYDITIHYSVYDSKTNQKVFEREDSRSRDTDNPSGMFNRSFDNFFNTLNKLTKK